MVDECSKGESCKKWCMVRMGKKLQKVVQKLHKASCFEEMENALDKLDDLEYELEKAYEWLDDHKGDKRKSCSSRKKVCMLQKACERLRDAYEDEFEEESSDEDDDGWVCMESLVHQVGIPKMEEKETKKEAGQKSLEEPLDNLILPLESAHGVEEEYPLLKITPILSNERMEIGIWREDLNSQESKKGTPHYLILTPTTIDAIDVSCLNEEDFSKEHAIHFHKAHEMLIYPLISYGVLLEAILCPRNLCTTRRTPPFQQETLGLADQRRRHAAAPGHSTTASQPDKGSTLHGLSFQPSKASCSEDINIVNNQLAQSESRCQEQNQLLNLHRDNPTMATLQSTNEAYKALEQKVDFGKEIKMEQMQQRDFSIGFMQLKEELSKALEAAKSQASTSGEEQPDTTMGDTDALQFMNFKE
ncbi:hypothetical protein L7F22_026627 [Adiantum nelumboides]|nr:hypothetical protein [Adiantum nelumboides]